jgi:hypothetical protein
MLMQAFEQLFGRVTGPMKFRFILQPLTALAIAIRAGVRDAREHRPPFLWTLLTDDRERRPLLRAAWRDVSVVFIVAVTLDTVYQLWILNTLRPLQAVIVAALLAFVPYVTARGLATRVARRIRRGGS